MRGWTGLYRASVGLGLRYLVDHGYLREAVVRVARVGVCGTDFAGYLGKMPFFSYPRIPGHELGVEVVAVGDGVANVQPGDRCAPVPRRSPFRSRWPLRL